MSKLMKTKIDQETKLPIRIENLAGYHEHWKHTKKREFFRLNKEEYRTKAKQLHLKTS